MTDTPETEPDTAVSEGAGAVLAALIGGGANPKPDTAQGVADLLSTTRKHVEQHAFAQPGMLIDEETGAQVHLILKPSGGYEVFDPEHFDKAIGRPRFRTGTAKMTSLASFIDHVNRFGDADSAVFANEDRDNPSVLAVLDYHRADTLGGEGEDERVHGEYRFGRHRTLFQFPVSEELKRWRANDGNAMDMPTFAAFLEDNVLDVAEITEVPESAKRFVEMMGGQKNIADWSKLTQLAKSLTVFESGVVGEAVNLSSGEGQITIQNAHDTEVGGVKATVPTMFFIAIPIFREGVVYRLPVRLRYRKSGSRISFWYELWREDRAFADAFHEAVAKVETETEASIFYGQPE